METSQAGVDLIKEFEGFDPQIYKDSAGHETVGYGHKLTKAEKDSGKFKNGITKKEAEDLLKQDLKAAEKAVNDLVKVPLNQNQFDALVSFVFNIGRGNFARSTLLKELNKGNYHAVPSEIQRWNKAGGQVVPGLVNRRKKEAQRWSEPVKEQPKEEQPAEPGSSPPGGGGGGGSGGAQPGAHGNCCCPQKITITIEFASAPGEAAPMSPKIATPQVKFGGNP